MPSAPVFGDGPGKIRPDEVFLDPDAQHLPHTDGHVNAAGKISIQGNGIKKHPCQYIGPLILARVFYDGIHRHQQFVRNNQLFEVSPQDPFQAEADISQIQGMLREHRLLQIVKTADGALDKLREKRDKQGKLPNIPLTGIFPPVHINQIAHGLKRIKGNPQRKQKTRKGQLRNMKHAQQPVEISNGKVCIFQHRKYAKIEYHAGNHPLPLLFFHLCLIGLAFLSVQFSFVFLQIACLD